MKYSEICISGIASQHIHKKKTTVWYGILNVLVVETEYHFVLENPLYTKNGNDNYP